MLFVSSLLETDLAVVIAVVVVVIIDEVTLVPSLSLKAEPAAPSPAGDNRLAPQLNFFNSYAIVSFVRRPVSS